MQYNITPRIKDKGQAKAELRGSCHGKGRSIKADGELHLLQLPVGHQGWSEQVLLGEAVPPRRVIPQPLLTQPPEWSLASRALEGAGSQTLTFPMGSCLLCLCIELVPLFGARLIVL